MKNKIRYYRQDGTEYSFSKEPKIKITQTSNADMNIGLPMKETAVDWLFTQLWETPKDKMTWYKILMDAKQMEKEQIQDAYWDGIFNGEFLDGGGYYKEVYGGE